MPETQSSPRLDRGDEAAGGPFAEAVMRPEQDVGAVAGGRGLLELVGQVGVDHLDGDRHAVILGELRGDLLERRLVAVGAGPDQQLAVLEREGRQARRWPMSADSAAMRGSPVIVVLPSCRSVGPPLSGGLQSQSRTARAARLRRPRDRHGRRAAAPVPRRRSCARCGPTGSACRLERQPLRRRRQVEDAGEGLSLAARARCRAAARAGRGNAVPPVRSSGRALRKASAAR